MNKQEHINYWSQLALNDFDTAVYNLEGQRNVPALFFFHLCIEKMLKANWVKDNLTLTPPFTHDLQKIASETDIDWTAENFDYLMVVNAWNIEARYPDYKNTLHKIASAEYIKIQHQKVETLLQWLLKKL